MHLTVKQFCVYLRYIKRFEAYDQLRMFDAAVYPYMNKKDRQELTQKYAKAILTPSLITEPDDVETSWQLLRTKAWQLKDQV